MSFQASGRFATPHGARYRDQLCKHFAHKIPVVCAPAGDECHFAGGTATLRADETGLAVQVSAGTAEALAELREVIDIHLRRFAFREGDRGMDWSA